MRLPLLCCVLIAGQVHAQSLPTAEDSVRAMDFSWARAYATNDTLLGARVFSDSLVVTATDGSLKDKRGELRDVAAAPGMTVDYFRTSAVNVHMLPGAAVVTGLADWRVTSSGRSNDTRRRYTAVYSRGGPLGWSMVALHIGRAP